MPFDTPSTVESHATSVPRDSVPTAADEKAFATSVASQLGLDDHQIRRAEKSQAAFHGILRDVDFRLRPGMKILDVGCGFGARVCAYRRAGFDAFGIDVHSLFDRAEQLCRDEQWSLPNESVFRALNLDKYHFPFDNETFDLVYSDQLLEHVTNLDEVVSEVHRVLKPGGASLHVYPPGWLLIEPHIYVPFAGRLSYRWYLWLWAFLGIRKASQKSLSRRDIVEQNYLYLRNQTCYRSARKVEQICREHFGEIRHLNHLFVKHVPRPIRRIYPLLRLMPFSRGLIGTFLQRALFLVKRC